MGLVLDSTATVAAERAGFTARQLLQSVRHQLQDDDLAISVVTVLELAHGVARADTETRRAIRQRFLDEITAAVPVEPVSIPIAIRAGRLDGILQAGGVRLPLADLLIASTALELRAAVVTANLRHFQNVPDLRVIHQP